MIQTMEDRQSGVLETDDAYRHHHQGYAHFSVFYDFSSECVQEYHTFVNIVPCVTCPSRMLEHFCFWSYKSSIIHTFL